MASSEQQQQRLRALNPLNPLNLFRSAEIDYSRLFRDEKKRADELDNELGVLVQDFHNREQQIRTEYEDRIRQTKTKYENEIGQLRAHFRTESSRMQKAEIGYQSQIENMANKIEDMERRHKTHTRELLSGFDQREKEFELEKLELEKGHTAEKSILLTRHTAEQARLKRDIENLNGALIARDHFKPLTDQNLAHQFLDLAHQIEVVVGLFEWKFNETGWEEELLQKLRNHLQRKFRNALLHEKIWIVLYDNVFSTPFKVFGNEGHNLETQWAETFNKDGHSEEGYYTWPEPGFDTERWRYETIKGCQEALRQSPSVWDLRAKLKMDHQNSLSLIKKELQKVIEKVTDVDDRILQKLDGIATAATDMWINMGMQRCRLMVVMPNVNLELSPVDRIREARDGSLKLMKRPELRRFGNSKGENLDTVATVTDCQFVTESISIADIR